MPDFDPATFEANAQQIFSDNSMVPSAGELQADMTGEGFGEFYEAPVGDYTPVFSGAADLMQYATDPASLRMGEADGGTFDKLWSSVSKSLFGTDEKDPKTGQRTDKGLIGEAGSWVKENKEMAQLLAAGVGGALRSRSQERQLDEQRKWVAEQKEQDFKRQQEAAKYGRLGTGLLSVVQNQPKG